MTEIVDTKLKKIWSDFTVKDTVSYSTVLDTASVNASDKAKTIALGFFGVYSGWNGKAYGEGNYKTGLTEQQAHDLWQEQFNKQQALAKKQLIANGVARITQSVYDGIILLHWATGKALVVRNGSIEYRLLNPLINQDYDTVADMIINSTNNTPLCVKISTVLRLADYGQLRTREQYRSKGVFSMRDRNELGILTIEETRRARYAYYAETLKFLPFTPEGIKRDISNKYNNPDNQRSKKDLLKRDIKDYNDETVFEVIGFGKLNTFVQTETDGRVRVAKVEFMEHGKNTAIYEG